jgi:hypothetical protein
LLISAPDFASEALEIGGREHLLVDHADEHLFHRPREETMDDVRSAPAATCCAGCVAS